MLNKIHTGSRVGAYTIHEVISLTLKIFDEFVDCLLGSFAQLQTFFKNI